MPSSSLLARAEGDSEKETVTNDMYDKLDEIFKDLVHTKVGLPANVLNAFGPSFSEPEILGDARNKFVALRMQFIIKYRSLIT